MLFHSELALRVDPTTPGGAMSGGVQFVRDSEQNGMESFGAAPHELVPRRCGSQHSRVSLASGMKRA